MDPHDQNHRRTNTNPQSIPLQDLSIPHRSYTEGGEPQPAQQHGGRLRALTDISRDLWERGTSSSTSPGRRGWTPGGNYSPLLDAEREMSPTRPSTGMHLTIPPAGSGPGSSGSTPTSPLDGTDFQAALAGVSGLSFGPPPFDNGPARPRHNPRPSLPSLVIQTDSDSISQEDREDREDREDPFSSIPLDTMPLTQHLAPISGAGRSSTDGQGRDRAGSSARPNVHFDPSSPSSRLGDDLSQAESGALSPNAPRRSGSFGRNLSSLSPTSPLQRTGMILRQMSQRIVNISNEQDVVERSIRRKSSVKDLRAAGSTELQPVPISVVDGEEETIGRPIEKTPSVEVAVVPPRPPSFSWMNTNPLRGNSLGVFAPDNKLRLKLCDLLVHPWTEPTIFVLIVIQTILLAIDSSRPVQYDDSSSFRFGTSWIDYCLLILFSIYTVEIIIRTIVSGFILNPLEHSTINRKIGLRRALMEKAHMLFGTPHTRPLDPTMTNDPAHFAPQQPSFLRAFTNQGNMAFQGDSRQHQRVRLAHRAFLRHSFNRLDFVAVVAWWLSFILGLFSFESNRHMFVFRMLSCLRILRLLHLTSGTTVILRSLKKAAPLLVNVAFLIGFFWLLFAIVGVQSFKSSLRRECVWTDPNNSSNTWINQLTFCGGHINATTGQASPWLLPNLTPGATVHKGYICPVNSLCIEGQNPYNGSVSFDNIFQSLELVFVIMTTNTFTDLMYYLTNSDYLAAALFFAVGIIILFFWLVNLLVAVITSSFQVIREESKTSAFTGEDEGERLKSEEDEEMAKRRVSTIKMVLDKTKWAWILIITTGIVVQCMRSANMGPNRTDFVNNTETVVTFLLLLEIMLRIIVDWRNFFRSKRNLVDLGIAIITSIIQLPPIRNSGTPYAWLTFFQIIRIYRVVLAIPLTRELIVSFPYTILPCNANANIRS
jgi:voltage-dependent calcium channel